MSGEYVEEIDEETEYQPEKMGGKRKSKRRVNPALGKWVAFVKKVQKEEKLSYRDAMMRAKVRKDKGEKWMKGGDESIIEVATENEPLSASSPVEKESEDMEEDMNMEGGRRRRKQRRKTHKRRGSKKRRHTRRR